MPHALKAHRQSAARSCASATAPNMTWRAGSGAGLATLQVMTGISAGLDPATLHPQADYIMDAFAW